MTNLEDTVLFQECGPCSAKLGHTYLCASCLNNRNNIENLKVEVRSLRRQVFSLRNLGRQILGCFDIVAPYLIYLAVAITLLLIGRYSA